MDRKGILEGIVSWYKTLPGSEKNETSDDIIAEIKNYLSTSAPVDIEAMHKEVGKVWEIEKVRSVILTHSALSYRECEDLMSEIEKLHAGQA